MTDKIRTIQAKDYQRIAKLVKESFEQSAYGYHDEAILIEKIRADRRYIEPLEVVALKNEAIVGYGLLSEASVSGQTGLVLAPLAVKIENQGQGIGKAVIQCLEPRALALGYPFISILGSPDYYQKLGYIQARQYQIEAPFEVDSAYFLIKALIPEKMRTISGVLEYLPAFT